MQAVIIGAGLSGLAAAAACKASGLDVLVVEQQSESAVLNPAYGSPTISHPPLYNSLFNLLDVRLADVLPIARTPTTTTYEFGNSRPITLGMYTTSVNSIRRVAPDDVAGYEQLCRLARNAYQQHYLTPQTGQLQRFTDVTQVFSHFFTTPRQTVSKIIKSHISSPELQQALEFSALLHGADPRVCDQSYLIMHYLNTHYGQYAISGGYTTLARCLIHLLRQRGVTFAFNQQVTGLDTNDQHVQHVICRNNDCHSADVVIMSGDPQACLNEWLPSKVVPWYRRMLAQSYKPSASQFVATFTLPPAAATPSLTHWVNVADFSSTLAGVFNGEQMPKAISFHCQQIARTSAGTTYQVVVPQANLALGNFDWRSNRHEYWRLVSKALAPYFSDLHRAEHLQLMTPLDFHALQHSSGASHGLPNYSQQTGWCRYQSQPTTLENLFLVGSSTLPGPWDHDCLHSVRLLRPQLAELQATTRELPHVAAAPAA